MDKMKAKFLCLLLAMMFVATSMMGKSVDCSPIYSSNPANRASVVFKNDSNYTMTLKIVHSFGGLYATVSLPKHSSSAIRFWKSGTFKLKIKAERYGLASYHDGGTFSVTCSDREWTEGEMTFQMSEYGSGLGPSISAAEFESDK